MNILKNNFELIFWMAALAALGFCDPAETHFVLCPLRLTGFTWCPGCGIGHAIACLLHGNLNKAWHAHWFGVPALVILLYRVCYLIKPRRYRFPITGR